MSALKDDSFGALKLQTGDRLQIEIPTARHDMRYFTTLIGYARGLSVLVHHPLVNGLPLPMSEGKPLIVRGFSGLDAFSFESAVARVCIAPFRYLHLSYPHVIQTIPVRHEIRARVSLPARISPAGGGEGIAATLSNLSINGILVDSIRELGAKNDEIGVDFSFTIQPNDYEVHIEARGIIQNVAIEHAQTGETSFQYGIKLQNLHGNQSILIQNLIYQQLLENHHNQV